MRSAPHADALITTCLRCHEPICQRNPQLWCIKCQYVQRQQGQARGLERSLKTRRLKAWLKTFPTLE